MKIKEILGSILFVIYAVVAIIVTVLILSFNEYNCSEIGNYTVYIVKDDTIPEYEIGDLILIKHASNKNIAVGDNVFAYKVITSEEFRLVHDKVVNKSQVSRYTTYTLEKEGNFDSSYVIGSDSGTKVIHGVGAILAVLESRWGYLFLVVIVSLILFLQELFELVMEIKDNKNEKVEENR